MKILIDINHPAHVHYFRNFIKSAESNGHQCIVTNRNSEMINDLLDSYDIKHYTRSKRPNKNSFINSFFYLFKMVRFIYKKSKIHEVDFYLGFASAPCSIVSFLRRKHCVVLDDTEHNKLNQSIYIKFCNTVITPFYFRKNLGSKQISINAYIEQLYLHSKYFTPKKNINDSDYVLIRFISYDAKHDSGVKGKLSQQDKLKLIRNLENRGFKVLISNEGSQSNEITDSYLLKTKVTEIHNVIANASFFISEGATMACEAGILGTTYFYINPLEVGNVDYQSENYLFANKGTLNSVYDFLDNLPITKVTKHLNSQSIEENTINPTYFLEWFIFNYPESKKIAENKCIDQAFINTHIN